MESLKANGAAAGVVFEGFLELVRCAVWVLADCGPVVEVGVDDEFTIEEDADLTVLAGDGEVIPFADGFGHALGWRHGIINGGDHAVFAAVSAVVDLDFERGEHVFDIAGAKEDAAVGFGDHFEFEIEDEVAIRGLGPECVVVFGDEFTIGESPAARSNGV